MYIYFLYTVKPVLRRHHQFFSGNFCDPLNQIQYKWTCLYIGPPVISSQLLCVPLSDLLRQVWLTVTDLMQAYRISSVIRHCFFPFQNSSKILDPSYETDLYFGVVLKSLWKKDIAKFARLIKIITIHHECPCTIGKSHPRGRNFYQRPGLPLPWRKFQPRAWDLPILHGLDHDGLFSSHF